MSGQASTTTQRYRLSRNSSTDYYSVYGMPGVVGIGVSGGKQRLSRWKLCVLTVILMMGSMTSAHSQSDEDQAENVEELRAQRREVHADRLANAKAVDVETAAIEDLNEALSTFQQWINNQQLVVEIARAEAQSAQQARDEALADVAILSQQLQRLEDQIRESAVRSFVEGDPVAVLLESGDPTVSIRRESLVQHLYIGNDDLRDELRRSREELIVGEQRVILASEVAEEKRLDAEEHYRVLVGDSARYQTLLSKSEVRLETLLFERQTLVELDQSISSQLTAAEGQLATLLGTSGFSGGSGGGRGETVSPADVVDVGYGVEVHRDIAENVRTLLAAARLDGVNLAGGGYRDAAAQIRVRRNNCGTSDFAIYEMSPSKCRPPTARPGTSMHEQGRAIDFTYNGALITSRSGAGWEWLETNASSYGLFNLPYEPWHFSTNGS